ncbi:putative protein farnesyltransferase [Monocercomonoides exilis]|uniref:putative protein farnesyltransferase n=1 Tax=Monocercomonoides exilis TaxID=2049356 RepID=UPI003559F444|nr:putative protein farnesyltransferase [Monocercomonoides exilis]|eukprot:MONOS_5478.1-p1 / transcript=MONOS_5478.1 / gene=MONOS_5478 / organism=Monocercomonoides_exilis_PA203 / gene_product=protein farnesyltransferase / transcript_product=protein farnesyltransferase / location=Mono_scaffold00160:9296-11911(-) / protein_length=784 / sequence_SO=supercontig / SO=protein_coding / is_pseudo=false
MQLDPLLQKHISFFYTLIFSPLPSVYVGNDSIRTTFVQFGITGLASLNSLSILSETEKQSVRNWLISCYLPGNVEIGKKLPENIIPSGFRGCTSSGNIFDAVNPSKQVSSNDYATISSTYSSLLSLKMLYPNEPLSNFVNTKQIAYDLKFYQNEDGSFNSEPTASDSDARMCFCACACAYLCGKDFDSIDKEKLINHLLSLQSYEGGFGGRAGNEAHAGYTFCVVAALSMLGALDRIRDRVSLEWWCLQRQRRRGFNGRTQKLEDVCYTWWVGATLKLLNIEQFASPLRLLSFIAECEDCFSGGIHKDEMSFNPDPLHSGLGVMGMSLFMDAAQQEAMEIIEDMEKQNKERKAERDKKTENEKEKEEESEKPLLEIIKEYKKEYFQIPVDDWYVQVDPLSNPENARDMDDFDIMELQELIDAFYAPSSEMGDSSIFPTTSPSCCPSSSSSTPSSSLSELRTPLCQNNPHLLEYKHHASYWIATPPSHLNSNPTLPIKASLPEDDGRTLVEELRLNVPPSLRSYRRYSSVYSDERVVNSRVWELVGSGLCFARSDPLLVIPIRQVDEKDTEKNETCQAQKVESTEKGSNEQETSAKENEHGNEGTFNAIERAMTIFTREIKRKMEIKRSMREGVDTAVPSDSKEGSSASSGEASESEANQKEKEKEEEEEEEEDKKEEEEKEEEEKEDPKAKYDREFAERKRKEAEIKQHIEDEKKRLEKMGQQFAEMCEKEIKCDWQRKRFHDGLIIQSKRNQMKEEEDRLSNNLKEFTKEALNQLSQIGHKNL